MQRLPYASGGTELPWYSSGRSRKPSYAPDEMQRLPYASGGTELPWYSSGRLRKPPYASGGTELPWYSPGRGGDQLVHLQPGTSVRTKADKWVPTTEIEPASSLSELSSSGEITPASSSKVLPPSEQEGYPAQTATKQPNPQSSQSKSFSSNPASKTKDLFSKLKFRPRMSATGQWCRECGPERVAGYGSH
jgi:hypothetical protein